MQPIRHRRWSVLPLAVTLVAMASPVLAISAENAAPRRTDDGQRVLVAQTQYEAQLALRIQQLEEQIRTLTGQMQGLSFQISQMQQQLEPLEEGNSTSAPAGDQIPPTTQPETETVPQTVVPERGVVPLPGEQEFDPRFDDGSEPLPADGTFQQDGQDGRLGPSSDPLIGAPEGADALLGTLPVAIADDRLDLTFDPEGDEVNPDATAQFSAGYDAIERGDYDFAADQFRQFVALYPDDERAPVAASWLGTALLEQGQNQDAAEVLLEAYEADPEGPGAPGLLLQLGVALSRQGERDAACRTMATIPDRFEGLTEAFSTRLREEQESAECPPA